jgi:hypothetical protein
MNAPSKTIRNSTEIVFIGLAGEKNPGNRPGRRIQARLRRVFWLAREGPAAEVQLQSLLGRRSRQRHLIGPGRSLELCFAVVELGFDV